MKGMLAFILSLDLLFCAELTYIFDRQANKERDDYLIHQRQFDEIEEHDQLEKWQDYQKQRRYYQQMMEDADQQMGHFHA